MSSEQPRTRVYKDEIDVALRDMLDYQSVDEEIHAGFETAVLTMRRRLLPYAADVEDYWHDAQIDAIPHECSTVVTKDGGLPGHFGQSPQDETVVQPAPIHLLDAWSEALVEIYSRLGFAPEVDLKDTEWKI